ncbi:MAG: hypothetical protein F6K65_19370 [Moorea sp. SIO3C2]|nr:hypothetical protein [Moorena sp. SIO3C2]
MGSVNNSATALPVLVAIHKKAIATPVRSLLFFTITFTPQKTLYQKLCSSILPEGVTKIGSWGK